MVRQGEELQQQGVELETREQLSAPQEVVQDAGEKQVDQMVEAARSDGESKLEAAATESLAAKTAVPIERKTVNYSQYVNPGPLVDPHFQFPDPVKPDLRKYVGLICYAGTVALTVVLNHSKNEDTWYIIPVILGDFVLRTLFGPTPLSPFGMVANAILFAFRVQPDYVPSKAKRFSFFLGSFLCTVLTTLHFGIDSSLKQGPLLVLTVFSGLESIGGFCIGCWFFATFFKLRDRWYLRKDYSKLRSEPNVAYERFFKLVDNQLPEHNHGFDFDMIVIGGGSGGLSASKEAARLHKKVAVLDYVQGSPSGTTWGLGGTCVNVGCIPKKLMHTAALMGDTVRQVKHYGWKISTGGSGEVDLQHSWTALRDNVHQHIDSLNEGYIRGLRSSKVQYINGYGSFKDAHTIEVRGANGEVQEITGRRILIAVGGTPVFPNIPGAKCREVSSVVVETAVVDLDLSTRDPEWESGAGRGSTDKAPRVAALHSTILPQSTIFIAEQEYGISSDDVFTLEKPPGRTVIVGASYIALETAGFLRGLGFDVTVLVRSIVLRGFDRDMADRVQKCLIEEGVKFISGMVPTAVEKKEDGTLCVVAKPSKGGDAEVTELPCDTVLFAVGRKPTTAGLHLERAGVHVNKNMKIFTYRERTTVPHIYAVGDCVDGCPELTPVAIKAGLLLAKRLYNKSDVLMDYNFIPTTVFTPIEYGSIGFTEEQAVEAFGDENIEVFHSEFTPLENYLCEPSRTGYAKVIVNYLDKERVIGFHYFGPNAGEVTQGFGAALRSGMKKAMFDSVVGIHPTCAEEMVSLRRTKRSGVDPVKTGC